ncbi:MAG: outer membrane protein insertion porin family [Mariniblastus sp.]|jgi:outer membrane protein insertion porin family
MMRKYSVSTLACCDRSLTNQSPLIDARSKHPRWFACPLVMIVIVTVLLSSSPSQAQAKPRQATFAQPNVYNIGTPPTQGGTYQYPASAAPRGSFQSSGFQPQAGLPANPGVFPAQAAQVQPYQVPQSQGVLPYVPPQQFQALPNQTQAQGSYFNQPAIQQQQQSFPQPNISGQPGILDLDVTVPQNPTGRFSVGGTYGSDNGLVGQFIVDEKDFDILRWPRNVQDLKYAWRGGGQHFRAEIVPGTELERYLVSWSNPYFRNSDYSLSLSGYLQDRQYLDWDEERVGGRVSVGRKLTNYLSVSAGLRLEDVTISNPRVGTSPQLNANLGSSDLFLGSFGLVYDTRFSPYLTGEGSYFAATFTQAFGDYSYSRADIDFRNYRTLFSRPDGSGRHTLEFRTNLGFSGSSTPVFENYFAGGMTSLRGFDFRGVSPIDGDVRVGGEFQWLNSLEYKFPLTNDDMIHGVMFLDFGTVEEGVSLNSENFRVAPGVGLRVHLPFAGLGAPLAFDFALPISTASGDDEQSFGFLIGIMR